MPNPPDLPANTTIEFEIRITQNNELLRKGIGSLDSEGKPMDFINAGLAIQRTAYELLQAIWTPEEISGNSPPDVLE